MSDVAAQAVRFAREASRRPLARCLLAHDVRLAAVTSAAAVALAYVLVRHSPALAVALLFALPALWVATRANMGLLVGLVLILVLPSWQTFGTAQVSVLRLASLAAASTLLFSHQRIRPNATDGALLFLLIVTVAGWLLQYDHPSSGRVLGIELTPLGFYIGARAMPLRQLDRVFVVTLFAGTIGALTVIYEYLVGHTVFLDSLTYQWSSTSTSIFRPGGIFGGPPQASTALCFVIVFGLAAHRSLRKGRHQRGPSSCLLWVTAACVGVCTVALALTFTRAAFVGIGAGVLLFLLLIRSPALRPTRVAWALGLGFLVVLIALPRLQPSTTIQEGVFRSGTLQAREGYWSAALPIVTSSARNAIFGIGTTALEVPAVNSAAPIPLELAVRPLAYQISLHSQYVTELVENGLIGLSALVVLIVVPLVRVLRAAWATADDHLSALAAAILAVSIVMTVDTALLDGTGFAMLMVTIAFAGRAIKPHAAREGVL